jgi:hypothetical protein
LIIGIARKIVTAISLFTFITFTFIAFYDFYAGNSISCGCFGGIQFLETSPFSRIIYNFLFVLFSLTILLFDDTTPLRWPKAKWVCLFISSASLIAYHLNYKQAFSSIPAKSSDSSIIYLPDQYLKEFKETLIFASSNNKIHTLRSRDGEFSDLNKILVSRKITLLLFFTPFDCQACFYLVGKLANNLLYNSDQKIQIIGIALEGRQEDVYKFKELVALDFPVYTINVNLKNRVKTPVLILVTYKGIMLYGAELTPNVENKKRIFVEIESKITSDL